MTKMVIAKTVFALIAVCACLTCAAATYDARAWDSLPTNPTADLIGANILVDGGMTSLLVGEASDTSSVAEMRQ